MKNRCNPSAYGLIKNGDIIHCWRCIPCGIGGKWYRKPESRDRALEEHKKESGDHETV